MIVKIDVTQADIENGQKGKSRNCPLTLAIFRALGPQCDVYVAPLAWITVEGERLVVQMPKVAICFMRDFDADFPVKPFSFELEVVDVLNKFEN